MKHTLLVLLFLTFLACHNNEGIKMQLANSIELKNDSMRKMVLSSFEGNDEKLKEAARFMLDNMNYHSAIAGQKSKAYLDAIQKYYQNDSILLAEIKLLQNKDFDKPDPTYDLTVVDKALLIRNIQTAFKTYNRTAWKDQVSFEVFCNYLLPYRINNELLGDDWRSYFTTLYFQDHDSLLYEMSLEEATAWIQSWLYSRKNKFKIFDGERLKMPALPCIALDKLNLGTCHELTIVGAAALRSFGIPATIDFTPSYINISAGHEWNCVIVNPTYSIPFDITTNKLFKFKQPKDILGKVYRRSFGYNVNSHANQRGYCEFLPEFLNNPFIEDVTSSYIKTCDLEIEMKPGIRKDAFCYLWVFKPGGWKIIGWGKMNGNYAHFEDVGMGGVYLASFIDKEGSTSINAPFIVGMDGTVEYVSENTSRLEKAKIIRKFPISNWKIKVLGRMIGGRFEGANLPDFSDAEVLHEVKERPEEHYTEVKVAGHKQFRYIRYYAPESSFGNVAEIKFYQSFSDTGCLKGSVLGTEGSIDRFTTKNAAVDGKDLTFFNSNVPDSCWVGLDLAEKKSIEKIRFLPRNDMNSIQTGYTYELFSWHDNKWNSLGVKAADAAFLLYDNVPKNSLLWLKCHTKGIEERIFTYKNDKQYWW